MRVAGPGGGAGGVADTASFFFFFRGRQADTAPGPSFQALTMTVMLALMLP